MASAPKQSAEISILTLDYAALLQSLCAINRPNVNDVTAIFREFRRSLDVRKPKSSSKPSTSPSPSSGASKKRGVKSAASTSAESDGADFDGCGSGDSHEGFERFCTWEPEVKPCWITSDLDLWNRILARNCIELREHKWGEFSLKGYQWPEQKPALRDMLRASLLIHILLRQHRCVTHIFLDMSVTTIERYILWHAIKTGAGGVTRFDCRPSFTDIGSLTMARERTVCCEAIATMTNLTLFCLSDLYITGQMARTIGAYLERTTVLTTLQLIMVVTNDINAGVFLDHLARNRSLKSLSMEEFFVIARQGQALADVVLNHATLEELLVKGPIDFRPSALLAAAVQSTSLRSLAVQHCRVDAEDIRAMAYALARAPLCFTDEMLPPTPPTSRLRELSFLNGGKCYMDLQEAYANLIGGKYMSANKARLF
ncbi:uncharacterized protein LOC119164681 [Rhipicephalus microplus]|uniref:uncharacterized protein LOC119164681 n=1 Tax=Rhipicephalus microplus TaxID=6941 RepID=UPI003F6CE75D